MYLVLVCLHRRVGAKIENRTFENARAYFRGVCVKEKFRTGFPWP